MPVALREINKIAPKEKPFMVAVDGEDNLYVEIFPSGRKTWKFRTMKNGKKFKMTLGNFDSLHISEIRNRAKELEVKLYRGEPLSPNKAEKGAMHPPMKFKEVAERFMRSIKNEVKDTYMKGLELRLRKYINPVMGELEMPQITSRIVLDLIEKIKNPPDDNDPIFENARRMKEKDENAMFETANRIKKQIGQIMRYGQDLGEIQHDPTAGLRLPLRKGIEKHFASAKNTTEIKKLINAVYRYDFPIVRGLLLFTLLTFVRPTVAREATWSEIDWEQKRWTISAERMKGKREHLVPLSVQSLKILEEMKKHSSGDWIFPGRDSNRPLSDSTARQALKGCGYQPGEMTVHGFRHTASTAMNGTRGQIRKEVIRFQLAHKDNSIDGKYNLFEYEPERIEMMQYWADFLWELITP